MASRDEDMKIRCSGCGYDLSVAGDTGTCSECGRTYDKASLATRPLALTCFALAVIGCSAISIMMVKAATEARNATGDMPHLWLVQRLTAVPVLMLCGGTITLALLTGHRAVERWWPFAVIAAISGLILFSIVSAGYSRGTFPGWAPILQGIAPHAVSITSFGAAAVSAVVLSRTVRDLGEKRLAKAVWSVALVSLATIVFQYGISQYISNLGILHGKPGGSFFASFYFSSSVEGAAELGQWVTLLVIALVSLRARALWSATLMRMAAGRGPVR